MGVSHVVSSEKISGLGWISPVSSIIWVDCVLDKQYNFILLVPFNEVLSTASERMASNEKDSLHATELAPVSKNHLVSPSLRGIGTNYILPVVYV